jgi:AraC-like DNA-binding protein
MLLDPCVHLRIRDGRAELLGVVRGTHRERIEGAGCVVGVKFRPGGFYPFVEQPVARWTDRAVPAEEVFDAADDRLAEWARDVSGRTVECRGDASAHAAVITPRLDAFLGARLPARDATAEDVADLVALVAASAGVRRVSDLVRASGRSERTLHRLFARYVGVSPAWLIRRCRLRAAAERLRACSPADVRAVAWELGYADQAHFIRDFRATIGVTPGAYVQARG